MDDSCPLSPGDPFFRNYSLNSHLLFAPLDLLVSPGNREMSSGPHRSQSVANSQLAPRALGSDLVGVKCWLFSYVFNRRSWQLVSRLMSPNDCVNSLLALLPVSKYPQDAPGTQERLEASKVSKTEKGKERREPGKT